MPLYQYECKSGHRFEALVRMDLSNEPARCPMLGPGDEPKHPCGSVVTRQLTAPSKLFPGADSWRK